MQLIKHCLRSILLVVFLIATAGAENPDAWRLVPQVGHSDSILDICISPNGRFLATSGEDLTVHVMDLKRDLVHAVLDGYSAKITSMAFVNNRQLATICENGELRLWDLQKGTFSKLHQFERGLQPLIVANHSRYLLAAKAENKIWVFDLYRTLQKQKSLIACFEMPGILLVYGIAFDSDGTKIAACTQNGHFILWTIQDKKLSHHSRHRRVYNTIALNAKKNQFIVGGDHIYFFDIETETFEESIEKSSSFDIFALSVSPDGNKVGAAHDGKLHIWDITTKEEVWVSDNNEDYDARHCFLPHGNGLIVIQDNTDSCLPPYSTLVHVDLQERKFSPFGYGGRKALKPALALTRNNIMAVSLCSNIIQLWDLTKGEFISAIRGGYGKVNSLIASPDGKRLASCEYDRIVLWETTAWSPVATIASPLGSFSTPAFSRDSKWMLTNEKKPLNEEIPEGAKAIKIWDALEGKLAREIQVQGKNGYSEVHFLADSRRLVAVTPSNKLVFLDSPSHKRNPNPLAKINLPAALQSDCENLSPDPVNPSIILSAKNALYQYQYIDHRLLCIEKREHFLSSPFGNPAHSPDGGMIAYIADKNQIVVRRTGDLKHVVEPWAQAGVGMICFSYDGKFLVTMSKGGMVRVWDVGNGLSLVYQLLIMPSGGLAWHPDSPEYVASGDGITYFQFKQNSYEDNEHFSCLDAKDLRHFRKKTLPIKR